MATTKPQTKDILDTIQLIDDKKLELAKLRRNNKQYANLAKVTKEYLEAFNVWITFCKENKCVDTALDTPEYIAAKQTWDDFKSKNGFKDENTYTKEYLSVKKEKEKLEKKVKTWETKYPAVYADAMMYLNFAGGSLNW